jgi:lycopene beta-cyclase
LCHFHGFFDRTKRKYSIYVCFTHFKNGSFVRIHFVFKRAITKEEYETEIQNYIQKLGITNYEIIDKEQGNIPMTSYPFWKHNTKRIIHIGSAGGWTKASTGYTFKNATKKSMN